MGSYKDRLVKSDPVWGDFIRNKPIAETVIAGGVAGDLTVSGIRIGDELISVIDITNGVDLTDEFSIIKDDTINNTGGTSTAAAVVKVSYWKFKIER